MSAKVEIINQALIKLGANTIIDLAEGSIESTLANQVWDTGRRAVLRVHPWNFAIKEQALARVISSSSYLFNYAYQVPSDFLRLIKVFDNTDYKLQGKMIYTNKDTCVIKYVFDQTDPNLWEASFTNALAAKLAYELCYPITKSTSLMESLYGLYTRELQTAKFIDASEDIPDEFPAADSPFISVRY